MKKSAVLSFIILGTLILGINTLSASVKRDSLFTVEYKTTAFTIITHNFVGYANSYPKYDRKHIDDKYQENSEGTIFDTHHFRIKKNLNEHLLFGTGLSYTKERIPGSSGNIIEIKSDTTWVHSAVGAITYKYIGIPLFISAQLNYTKFFKAHFEAGVNVDFIYSEIHEHTIDYKYFYVYPGNAPPVIETVLIKTYDTNPRKDRASFNRITPYLSISFERYLFRNKLSLNIGSVFYFKSIYQEHNTGEHIKNIRFSPLTLGLNFHL